MHLARERSGWSTRPLATLTVHGAPGATLVVRDGEDREYLRAAAIPELTFLVGGSLGEQRIQAIDASGRLLEELRFQVDAESSVEDVDGTFGSLFDLCISTLQREQEKGIGSQIWRGATYHYYVPWILDHVHTAKGQQYIDGSTGEMVDVFRQVQRQDGLIWSFGFQTEAPGYGYHYWAYKDHGYAIVDGGILFARQPVEQHCEYNFVDCVHLAWKGNGDDAWMGRQLDAAVKALDFPLSDRARFSERFGLLKRGCTIDSWDFQARDQYLVSFPLGGDMLIDADRTKFVIFFGDNHGYAQACEQLVEMLECVGRGSEAERFRQRSQDIRERIERIAWNGRFFQHHIEEDPSVVRDFGVVERDQIVMSNAYALNRGIPHHQAVAILRTYLELRSHLPPRSPAEWYAIFPPFEKGFGDHNQRWQYMNGGVHVHMAGELARGACEHGFEAYGADILARVAALAKRTDGIVHFAYTGAWEQPPPARHFTPIDLAASANMDIADTGAPGTPGWMEERTGNDMRNLPVGSHVFAGVPYRIADPITNGRRVAVAVSAQRERFPARVEIPIKATAAVLYLVHTANHVGASQIAAGLRFNYADGSFQTVYLMQNHHLSGWWFPGLAGSDRGIAWRGANGVVGDVGMSWVAIHNPQPEKMISAVTLIASDEGAIYALVGLTLADRPAYHEPGPISTGGPDCWSAGLCLHALMEGVAGVKDLDRSYHRIRLSPRWCAAKVDSVSVTARYQASQGYVSYCQRHVREARTIELTMTGNGEHGTVRILLPPGATRVASALLNGVDITMTVETIEDSYYAVIEVTPCRPSHLWLVYS